MGQKKQNKIAESLNKLKNKFNWFLFTEIQDYKLTSKYIDIICPDNKDSQNAIEKLDKLVEESLIKEFSPRIRNAKSFRFLIDAVTYRIQRKELKEEDAKEKNIS